MWKLKMLIIFFYFIWYQQPIPYPPRGTYTRLPEQYARWTSNISSWTPKTVLTQTQAHFGMCFERTRVCVKILIWEDFGLQIVHRVVLLCFQTGSMPHAGGWCQENLCQGDFHRPRTFTRFDIISRDGENGRGIYYFSYIHQQTRLKINIQYQSKPAAKYWGSTRKQTFFFSRNGECKHVNRKPIIVCANKAIKKKFCWKFIWWYCTLV